MEVLKIELKDTPSFELRCKVETNSNEMLQDSAAVNLNNEAGPSQRPNLTRSKTRVRIQQPHVAKFRFRFKKPSPVAVLLFTAIGDGAGATSTSTAQSAAVRGGTSTTVTSSSREPGEIGQCFFPITFRPSDNKALGSLAVKAAELANQTQTGFITTKIEGTNINKVVGRILLKVVNQKSIPKSLLRKQTSYLDLRTSREKFAKPGRSGPSIDDLIARERASLCKSAVIPGEVPIVTVVFHCAASAQQDLLTDLRPIACIGTSSDIREDSFFKNNTGRDVRVTSILKPVTLQCSGDADITNEVLEVHLISSGSGNTVPFSASHTLQTFYPFNHYNWEYNWRWLPGTRTNTLDSFQSNGKESKVILSIVYTPPASHFASYEGLEVLIQDVELSSFSRDRNLVACVQLMESIVNINFGSSNVNTSPFKQQPERNGTEGTYNFNTAVMQFSPAGGRSEASSMSGSRPSTESRLAPAYFFFAINPFFRSKSHDHRLQITLYSVDRDSTLVWWKDGKIALSSIPLPAGLKRVLPRPENQEGVKCHLVDDEISQPVETPIANKMTVVLRWKVKEAQFLSPTIENSLDRLPLIQDLVFSLPETEFSSSSSGQRTAVSQVYLEEYKLAITKMGLDILQLRQENQQLSEENRRLEQHIMDMEASIVVTAADQRTLQPLSKADLIHRVVELSEHLTNERQSRKGYQDKVRTLQNQLIEKNDMVTQHMQLQEAHEAQQKLVRELQSKVEKYRKCCETSRKQESVINQLEALMVLEAGDRKAGNALSIVKQENADLRAMLREYQDSDPDQRRSLLEEKDETIASLRKELERLAKQCQNFEDKLSGIAEKNAGINSRAILEQTTKIYELEQKLKVAEAREGTLMKELEENGRKWAKEKARYEIKLTQLKTKLEAMTLRGAEDIDDQPLNSHLSLAPSRPLLAQNSQSSYATRVRDNRDRENHTTGYNRTRASDLPSDNQSISSVGHFTSSIDDRISF